MKYLPILMLLALTTVGSSSLLEMTQVLWSRVLGGGYRKVGKLDPLQVPVIKVDQSEGNTSYRVILRNLEISGLNSSTVDSVHIVRGRLKSNLSDNEAGYVSYNEQRDLDSIRYRFHTVVKESKTKSDSQQPSASQRLERIIQFDPTFMRILEDEEFLRGADQQNTQQRKSDGNVDASRENRRDDQQRFNRTNQPNFGDMRVAVKPTPKSPSLVRVVYTNNYQKPGDSTTQPQGDFVRPCIGACRRNPNSPSSAENQRYPTQQGPFPNDPNAQVQSRPNQNQRFNSGQTNDEQKDYVFNPQYKESSFSAGSTNGQQQFSVKGGPGNTGINYSGNYRNGQARGTEETNGPQQYNLGIRSGQISVENNGGEYFGPSTARQDQFSSPAAGASQRTPAGDYEFRAQYGGSRLQIGEPRINQNNFPEINYSGNYRSGQISVDGQTGNPRYANSYESSERGTPVPVYFRGSSSAGTQPPVYFRTSSSASPTDSDEYGYLCNDEEDRVQVRIQPSQRGRFAEETTVSYEELRELYKRPLVRAENQPGYVDVVYVNEKSKGSESRLENLRVAPLNDSEVYSLTELMKDLKGNQRYISYNFTEGESLGKRNNAARVASDSKRIKDLLRYAKDYQEQQGYFEQGVELVYHFGDSNDTNSNDTLTRRKRQHVNDTEEDDVMHVILRIRVPVLNVKAGYALMGKVGKQQLRGSGLLDGNFTDVIADFTVELKKVDNTTMIVRAARAKLVSKDRKVNLQGMDDKGPLDTILIHGLMAAEAVAAMIADDLATKALSEGDTDGTIYKLYNNLPAVEKAR